MSDDFQYPHVATIYLRFQGVLPISKRAENMARTLVTDAAICDIQRKTTLEVFQLFGLELSSPAVLYAPLADREFYLPNALIVRGVDRWNVAGEPRVLDAGDELDGIIVPLEGLNVTA